MKDLSSYEKVVKYCEVCRKTTTQVLETAVTVCLGCDTYYDNDADELFGEVDEFIE